MRVVDTREYRRLDAAHYLHPFSDDGAQAGKTRIITRAEGVYLYDSDGNKLLDGMSGLWCVNVGYGRREINDAASAQMAQLPYYNSFFQCATPSAITLAAELSDITPPGFGRVFFTGSGSEATDTAIRIIRRYWQVRGQPQKTNIIARKNAYHGSTIAAASIGGMKAMHEQCGITLPGVFHARQPKWFGEGDRVCKTAEEWGEVAANDIADMINKLGADTIAAFIGEPVQGAGGVVVPPPTYWPAVQKICDTHNVPVIADEVICGFGRTGEWFGSTTFNIRPKMMTMAKGISSGYLPMGGVFVHDDIAGVLAEKGGEFAHGFTYSGHPVCAAAALANLRILRGEKLIERARDDIGPYLQKQWQTLGNHPLVAETRGIGMVAALELADDKGGRFVCKDGNPAGMECRDLSVKNGLIMRAVGDAMIIAPPLVITRAEVDELTAKAKKTLDDLAAVVIPAKA